MPTGGEGLRSGGEEDRRGAWAVCEEYVAGGTTVHHLGPEPQVCNDPL